MKKLIERKFNKESIMLHVECNARSEYVQLNLVHPISDAACEHIKKKLGYGKASNEEFIRRLHDGMSVSVGSLERLFY